MQTQIYTCLWSDGRAKEMANYYCSIFKESKIISENLTVVNFEINNTLFIIINGGSLYKFSPATSFVVECETQEEIDYYWKKLGANGTYNQCGWLNDQFGVTWQIIPKILKTLMSNLEKSPKIIEAFMKMQKFDIQALLNV